MASYIPFPGRIRNNYLLTLLMIAGCTMLNGQETIASTQASYDTDDWVLVIDCMDLCSSGEETTISAMMVEVGSYFLETPYVAHTLEGEEERLVINVQEMDCTTFAEYCLALSRTSLRNLPSFNQFKAELQKIRYRDGVIEGYPSRLHYFCDWIHNNEQKGVLRDVSEELAHTPLNKRIDFMSTHPGSYQQLKENPALVETIKQQEKEISRREMYYVPESRVAELEKQLMEGDIVGITTGVEGLAISHVGILVERSGRIHLMHASSAAKKVLISDIPLEDYLKNSKSATGIMVARPL